MHQNSLAHLQPHLGKIMLGEIDKAHISKYQRARLKEKASPRSINIEIACRFAWCCVMPNYGRTSRAT
jgi:hypothetical protein